MEKIDHIDNHVDFSKFQAFNCNNTDITRVYNNNKRILEVYQDNLQMLDYYKRDWSTDIENLRTNRDGLKLLFDILYNLQILNEKSDKRTNQLVNKKYFVVSTDDHGVNAPPDISDVKNEIETHSTKIMMYNHLLHMLNEIQKLKGFIR